MLSISSFTTKGVPFLSQGNLQHLFKGARLRSVATVAFAILFYIGVSFALKKYFSLSSYATRIPPPISSPLIPSSREGTLESASENLSIPKGQVLLTTRPGSDINELIMALAYKRQDKQFFLLDVERIIENESSNYLIYAFNDLVSSLPSHAVLVIHDFHHLLSQIRTSIAARSLWQALKRNIRQGTIQCIAIITEKGRTSLAEDNTCPELFNEVAFPPLNVETCTSWLLQLKKTHETKYGCTFTDEAIKKAVKLADSYIQNKVLPGSALEILERASVEAKNKSLAAVDDRIIVEIVSKKNNIPLGQLRSERDRIAQLQETLQKNVFGQSEAIEAVIRAFKVRLFCNVIPTKPMGSFLFVGPTGTGKTLLAHQIARDVFNDENAVLRIDMANLVQAHCISTLIGVPPGYIGQDTDSHLTRKVETTPRCVVIFDEAEKAHPQVLNIFLRLLETGYMTDAKGRVVDFRETFVIATSNLGSNLALVNTLEELKRNAEKALKDTLPPEILNRFDKTLIFQPLTDAMIDKIIRKGLEEKIDSLNKGSTTIAIDPSAISFIQKQNKDHKKGARPILQSIDTFVIVPLIDKLLASPDQETITVTSEDNKIVLS